MALQEFTACPQVWAFPCEPHLRDAGSYLREQRRSLQATEGYQVHFAIDSFIPHASLHVCKHRGSAEGCAAHVTPWIMTFALSTANSLQRGCASVLASVQ